MQPMFNPILQQQLPQMPLPTSQTGNPKVNGPESAMQYASHMGPNQESLAMFDRNGEVFYVITTDGLGVPLLERFRYVKEELPTEDGNQYVSKADFEAAIAQIKEAINGISGPVQTVATDAAGSATTTA